MTPPSIPIRILAGLWKPHTRLIFLLHDSRFPLAPFSTPPSGFRSHGTVLMCSMCSVRPAALWPSVQSCLVRAAAFARVSAVSLSAVQTGGFVICAFVAVLLLTAA